MLSNLLVLLLATSGLAMPQPAPVSTPELHQRQFQIVNQECIRNCTWGCEDDVCPMLCTIKCRKPKKRAYLSGKSGELGIARRAGEGDEKDEEDEVQEFAVVDMSWKW